MREVDAPGIGSVLEDGFSLEWVVPCRNLVPLGGWYLADGVPAMGCALQEGAPVGRNCPAGIECPLVGGELLEVCAYDVSCALQEVNALWVGSGL